MKVLLVSAFIFFIFYLIKISIRERQQAYSSLNELDKKVFALYLRSFKDDLIKYNKVHSVILPFGLPRLNLESRIIHEIGKKINIVKVLDQSQEQQVGASVLALDDKWKSHVLDLMNKAQIIFFKPALTEGLIWEFRQIVEKKYLYKTIIILSYGNYDEPEIKKHYKKKFLEMLQKHFDINLEIHKHHRFLVIDGNRHIYNNMLINNQVFKNWKKNLRRTKKRTDKELQEVVRNSSFEEELKILSRMELNKRGIC